MKLTERQLKQIIKNELMKEGLFDFLKGGGGKPAAPSQPEASRKPTPKLGTSQEQISQDREDFVSLLEELPQKIPFDWAGGGRLRAGKYFFTLTRPKKDMMGFQGQLEILDTNGRTYAFRYTDARYSVFFTDTHVSIEVKITAVDERAHTASARASFPLNKEKIKQAFVEAIGSVLSQKPSYY